MTRQRLLGRVLLVLFRLSAPLGRPSRAWPGLPTAAAPASAPTAAALAEAAGLAEPGVRRALAALERAGLVDASGPRLTMSGLVVAASLGAASCLAPSAERARRPQLRAAARTDPAPAAPSARAGAARATPTQDGPGAAISSAA